jgi:chaperonin GroES
VDLQPLGDRVVVKPLARREISGGGVHIPDTASERPQEGIVLATGPDVRTLEPGARVLYTKYMGTEVKVGDDAVLIMPIDAILAVKR